MPIHNTFAVAVSPVIFLIGLFAARYQVGKILPVYVSPKDPSQCALERGDHLGKIWLFIGMIGIVASVSALYFWLFGPVSS